MCKYNYLRCAIIKRAKRKLLYSRLISQDYFRSISGEFIDRYSLVKIQNNMLKLHEATFFIFEHTTSIKKSGQTS